MIIKGKKVTLVPIKKSEKDQFWQMATKSYGADFWYGQVGKKALTKKNFFQDFDDRYFDPQKKDDSQCFWIMKDRVRIGEINYNDMDPMNKSTELDILIAAKEDIGRGYGSDALRTLMKYLFAKYKLHRIWLGVRVDNHRAIKVYQKLGFQKEGRIREAEYFNKKYVDRILMGILRKEF
ncbi:MAG: GNAT family protein [Patescibacteria group bacterium]